MSIIFIDDILFNDDKEQRTIRCGNCILFLILNCISIISGLFYLYFYFIIPYYQNSSNSLSLYLSLFHLATNIFYFIIFFEFCLYYSADLSFIIKIVTMFNPLIIFCLYYWYAILTHNLYVTYYNYVHNINKRIRFYKYLLFVVGLIFYIYTLLNIQYNKSQILSKNFFLISNYDKSFIDFFYIIGLIIIIYIIIKFYYVLSKKEDFISVNEYKENQERNEKIKYIFNLVITRNISFIIYFLLTFTPPNVLMLFKYFFSETTINTFVVDFITIFLISCSGTFIFCVRLLDPLMRSFIVNLIKFNRGFISNYKDYLLKEKSLNESFISNNSIDDFCCSENKINVVRNQKKTLTIQMKTISFTFGKMGSINNSKNKKKFGISTIMTKDSNESGNLEMNNMNNYNGTEHIDNKLNTLNEFYYEDQDNEDNKSKKEYENENDKNNKVKNEPILLEVNERADSHQEKEKGKDNNIKQEKKNLSTISLGSLDKKNNSEIGINNSKTIISKFRNLTISTHTSSNQEEKKSKTSLRNRIRSNVRQKTLRSNSSTSNYFLKRTSNLALRKKKNDSKLKVNEEEAFHEEISSFALMNFHLEMKDNIIRLIALSLSINECRMYDDIKEYNKYYNSTIPWENKDFYKERTLFKEYNEKNIPIWIGNKDEIKMNNITFKILSFCPFVFHHIRKIDNISIDDILASLDPINNIKKLKSNKVSGGRGSNCIFSTWDKKFIIKTVTLTERKILVEKMIIDYHCLMKESRSLLSRIYGVFKIELKDKGEINVIIQRNMNDLPIHTKLLTFDIKGSTVDRQSINENDISLSKEELLNKYKNKVLKDIDLGIIDMKFVLNFNEWQQITSVIDSDSMFLQNYEVTDYSLLIFVHKYRKEDEIKHKDCSRIFSSKDKKYIFNFSIIDYLGPFNFEKKGEKLAKELVGYIKKLKDTNFSVLDPNRYAKRFRIFARRIIIDG